MLPIFSCLLSCALGGTKCKLHCATYVHFRTQWTGGLRVENNGHGAWKRAVLKLNTKLLTTRKCFFMPFSRWSSGVICRCRKRKMDGYAIKSRQKLKRQTRWGNIYLGNVKGEFMRFFWRSKIRESAFCCVHGINWEKCFRVTTRLERVRILRLENVTVFLGGLTHD